MSRSGARLLCSPARWASEQSLDLPRGPPAAACGAGVQAALGFLVLGGQTQRRPLWDKGWCNLCKEEKHLPLAGGVGGEDNNKGVRRWRHPHLSQAQNKFKQSPRDNEAAQERTWEKQGRVERISRQQLQEE